MPQTRTPRIARLAWAIVAAILVVGSVGPLAARAAGSITKIGTLDVKLPDGAASDAHRANLGLLVDSGRRRAFQIILYQDFRVMIRAFDLDTRKLAASKVFARGSFGAGPIEPSSSGTLWIHTFDFDRGILYLPYVDSTGLVSVGGIFAVDEQTLSIVHNYPRSAVNIDPTKLDPTKCTTSSACLPQAPTANPVIKGLSLVPSELSGGQPKLLLLLQEVSKAPGSERNFNITYVAQWDTVSGRQDFMYRVAACGNSQLPGAAVYPVAIFQARLTSGIYVGCLTSGTTGQIVRIDFDNNGQPSTEAAYPGPLGVQDIIADEDDDRLMLRISNTEGQSWWVFDGSSKAYTGTAGTTVGAAKTANGLDRETGRLYVLAPPNATGNQASTGGLMYTDARRAPVPQMLSDDRFAESAAGWIAVDHDPTTGARTLYAMRAETSIYDVFRDDTEVGHDDVPADQDALTTDIAEAPGVTGHNFTGSAQGYGVRSLLVGGVNGVTPTVADVNDVRPGRAAMIVMGSPCGPGDRETVVGSVKNAALSNNLASASAAVAESDPGTKQDVGEPTGRCYPRPVDIAGNDQWDAANGIVRSVSPTAADLLKDYPRPFDQNLDGKPSNGKSDFDQYAGTPWPFRTSECSGDARDSAKTKLYPGDRGDPQTSPIPKQAREQAVPVDSFNSGVDCAQTKARVDGSAQVLGDSQTQPVMQAPLPDGGEIRVGEISSNVTVYLDPKRGLVSRATSTVRQLSIGNNIYIDSAYTVAEAWAGGRPGTASTSFIRRLCGVRIKDQAPGTHVFTPEVTPDQNDPTKSTVDPNGSEVNKNVDVEGCGDPHQANAGTQPVIDAMNRVLGSRGRAYAPQPDGLLAQGTPGGYLSSVQRDRLETISGQAVNNDSSTLVPALEITIFNDDPTKGRGRQLFQFAGVDASVTYGIFLLNPDETFTDHGTPRLPEILPPMVGPMPTYQPPPTPGGGPPAQRGPITILFTGLLFLFRSPKDALLAAAVWMLLFSPVHLMLRRRALRSLP